MLHEKCRTINKSRLAFVMHTEYVQIVYPGMWWTARHHEKEKWRRQLKVWMDQFIWKSNHKRLIEVTVDYVAAGAAAATHDGGGGGGMKCSFC